MAFDRRACIRLQPLHMSTHNTQHRSYPSGVTTCLCLLESSRTINGSAPCQPCRCVLVTGGWCVCARTGRFDPMFRIVPATLPSRIIHVHPLTARLGFAREVRRWFSFLLGRWAFPPLCACLSVIKVRNFGWGILINMTFD